MMVTAEACETAEINFDGGYADKVRAMNSLVIEKSKGDPNALSEGSNIRNADEITSLSTMCAINLRHGVGKVRRYNGRPVRELLRERLTWADGYCTSLGYGHPFRKYLQSDETLDAVLSTFAN